MSTTLETNKQDTLKDEIMDSGDLTEISEENKKLVDIAIAEEYLLRNDTLLLNYERQMFLDMVHSDALAVCAKGLGYERVVLNVLKAFSDAGNLILVINSSEMEEEYYKLKLGAKYIHDVANTAMERERVYLEGGVQFISTRILVVDLLKQRVPVELITGIVVLRAHTIIESCQEAFALRLYRQRNKTGFIKAFSRNAEAFTIGYGHIERIMRNLFLKELFIWPRFHATVQGSLKPYEAQTIELHVPLTRKLCQIQNNILDIMNYLVREVKRINRYVDMEEITVENCVTKKFHKILQTQLDCIWHQLNSQTKLIVADLKILRSLMISSMYNDAVSAFALLKRYRTTEYAINNSGWTLLDSAEQVFNLAEERVYNKSGEFDPEPCPKWKYLSEILKIEIPGDVKRCNENMETTKVLILCQDTLTCYQLKEYLTQSSERYLLYMAMRQQVPIKKLAKTYVKLNNSFQHDVLKTNQDSCQPINIIPCQSNSKKIHSIKTDKYSSDLQDLKENSIHKAENDLNQVLNKSYMDNVLINEYYEESYMLTMSQATCINTQEKFSNDCDKTTSSDENQSIFEAFPELDNLDITATIEARKQPLICIQTFKTERDGHLALEHSLEEIQPQYVIMYHSNVTAIRQLEVYEARVQRPIEKRLKVFFLIHAGTVEEQSYLTSLRREKQAFERIIETKRIMIVPEYQDGKTEEAFAVYKTFKDPELLASDNQHSRKAGGQRIERRTDMELLPKIIVDMREFRSDLPCLIHKRGIEIIPVTITIGDYILTPEICVERKSISDLIGSLNSGRLYNQCIQMQRFYTKPILLIEFDQNKPFHLQGKYMLSQTNSITQVDIIRKLQLLTLHFPKLRLIWSPSPYATAQLFEELKLSKPEPDAKQASIIGAGEFCCSVYDELKLNVNINDFLIRLPGVNTRNINKLMRQGGSLKELIKKNQSELSSLLDSETNGQLLWDVLHVTHLPRKDDMTNTCLIMTANRPLSNHSRFRRNFMRKLNK